MPTSKKNKTTKKARVVFNPNYDPNKVIIDRSFGVKDLLNYKKKIDANINIFKEAITKEITEKKRVQDMINALKADIKEARYYKKLKKSVK